MPLDPHKLLNWQLPEIEHTYAEKDTILYALGLGCGADRQAPDDLRFVYEKGLAALPTMAVVLAHPGNCLSSKESTVDYTKVLHGEQALTLHRPVPPAGTVVGHGRVLDLLDKGREKGAVLYSERTVVDKATGAPIATMTSTTMLRGDGGWGGKSGPQPAPHRLPETAPDLGVDLRTYPNSALIYRLSGDWNPLHADPKAAAAGGFERPILHGLCTFGVAGLALVKACCGGDPARLKHLQVRFSAPVYPGETIRTEMWRQGDRVSFRARVVERDLVVLNNGLATVA
jgi:acyl dehydratase